MSTWILVCAVISGFSILALELVREDEGPAREPEGGWQRMTDSDLDGLLQEFVRAADEPATLRPHLCL